MHYSGNVDLPAILPWLGKTQLEVLAVLASLLLFGAHAVTSALVKEKVLLSSKYFYTLFHQTMSGTNVFTQQERAFWPLARNEAALGQCKDTAPGHPTDCEHPLHLFSFLSYIPFQCFIQFL